MLDENLIARLVQRGVATETFRRLTPDKKERLYHTTIELFGEYGYDGLSVDRICRLAGISKGSFFQYFASKSHLLEFDLLVLDERLGRWVGSIKVAEKAALARDRLVGLYRSVATQTELLPGEQKFYLFVTDAVAHAGIELEGIDPARHFHDCVTEIIRRGVQTGEVRGDLDAESTAYLVSLVIDGLIRAKYSQREIAHPDLKDRLASLLFDGLKA
ncbi:MAG: TetR/AcrR family transcriptional regulator [candidate division Zixibacteria bacterium]|nr:TetR/AcrR family transcriptional regulator [candidate division Zixibacteria bacterium]